MPQREPESDCRAEVHHVDRELADSELLKQAVDHVGQVVEGVAGEGPPVPVHEPLAGAGALH